MKILDENGDPLLDENGDFITDGIPNTVRSFALDLRASTAAAVVSIKPAAAKITDNQGASNVEMG